jgi:glycosyltransferase involved in cell wall biosynthesis
MKILYDYQTFTNQVYGGISRYFYELMNHFSQNQDIKFEISLKYSNNHYLENVNFTNHKTFFKDTNFKGKTHIMTFLNEFHSKRILLKHDFDVFHPTYYNPYFLKYIDTKPFVITVYDMIHELYPELFSKNDNVAKWKKILTKKADMILAISENTKKDLIEICDVPENKVKVVYLASSLISSNFLTIDKLTEKYDISKPYILYVGTRNTYKNYLMLLDVYSNHFSEKFNLICFGGNAFNKIELEKIANIKNSHKVIQLSGSDDLLASLYKHAFCFVLPSLYEGFGIPLLEAMSMGCPVVASKASSIPEVVGNAAILFDPHSKEELIDAVESLYDDSKRNYLIKRGFEQEKKFNWDKMTNETLDIYKSIL